VTAKAYKRQLGQKTSEKIKINQNKSEKIGKNIRIFVCDSQGPGCVCLGLFVCKKVRINQNKSEKIGKNWKKLEKLSEYSCVPRVCLVKGYLR
jgi:hypothetical protein